MLCRGSAPLLPFGLSHRCWRARAMWWRNLQSWRWRKRTSARFDGFRCSLVGRHEALDSEEGRRRRLRGMHLLVCSSDHEYSVRSQNKKKGLRCASANVRV